MVRQWDDDDDDSDDDVQRGGQTGEHKTDGGRAQRVSRRVVVTPCLCLFSPLRDIDS